MARQKTLDSAVIMSSRKDAIEVIKRELNALQINDIMEPQSREECMEMLVKMPGALWVLDWSLGAEDAVKLLAAARDSFGALGRPTFLMVPEINASMIATGYEYGVSQIHAGDVSADAVRIVLESLVREFEINSELSDKMSRVSNARECGEWNEASVILKNIFNTNPDNPRIRMELAENHIYEGKWDEAIALVEPYLEVDPPFVRALHLYARCLMQKGEYDKAIAHLEKAKILNPYNVDRLVDLGNAFLATDQLGSARENFDDAFNLDDGRADVREGIGKCMMLQGEVNEALILLKETSGPREMAAIFNSAAILAMRVGQHEKGMSLYKTAFKALGGNKIVSARIMFNMGLGYKRWSKFEDASKCFNRASEFDPAFEKAKQHKKVVDRIISGIAPATSYAGDYVEVEDFTEESIPTKNAAFDTISETLLGDIGLDQSSKISFDDWDDESND